MNPDLNLLEHLCGEIESAWRERKDRALVQKLSIAHPDLRDELYDFFEALVFGSRQRSAKEAAAEGRIEMWLREVGVAAALAAASEEPPITTTEVREPVTGTPAPDAAPKDVNAEVDPPRNWVLFLRTATGKNVGEIAADLPHASGEFLTLVGRYPGVVPGSVKRELAARLRERFDIDEAEVHARLSETQGMLRAASRDRPFSAAPATFLELLSRSALSGDQQNYWRRLANVTD